MICIDTNVISETMKPNPNPQVMTWLLRHDHEIGLPTIAIAEIAFGIGKLQGSTRAMSLQQQLDAWRERFAARLIVFDETAALVYGSLMSAALRQGRAMTVLDGLIGALALRHNAKLATRNTKDFDVSGLNLINPWIDA
jgi:predicted nucleic acid-binding protein